ncbi:pyridine nucleotide-disulfide oxidoreductase-like protein [Apodospora peruviana]|uniref:Pyridine nucleotide-disulfide oxidoreductase-like protein n=1 Tax=Apodospora peruviana TaxID=516989 RepID=A0AAE0IJN2_9PEZI|nr:pyridine nucleotide-disulfide oxidoreductase-like protein [Apodospora peruviana]
MTATEADQNGVNTTNGTNGSGNTDGHGANGSLPSQEDLALYTAQQKYAQEASKRLRPEGASQFVQLKNADSSRIRSLEADPWADHAALNAKPAAVKDGATYKFVIAGAGYGGLLFAVRLIQAGLASGPEDIRLIDAAGGFGGTWWWNRYPGLHCDVESYTYMPLLEETGYVPKKKYASGPELREHADRIATQWNLHGKVLFRATVRSVHWDEEKQDWHVRITEGRGPEEESRDIEVRAKYFIAVSGLFSNPHVPKIPGLDSFAGQMFHTARWNYHVSGGGPDDWALKGLEGKRVGIIGTGATAIQVVPQLARWAKEVYVFQRTPSAVNWRGQRATDPEEWKTKIANKKGWQAERMANLNAALSHELKDGEEDMINDAWTKLGGYCATIGSSKWGIIEPTPEKIGEHVARIYKLDFPCTEATRARVDDIVADPKTAASLKAWYPSWCKRPTFSDEYLQAFNLPHVHLIDTDGKGVDSATSSGLVVGGSEYPLDVLVLSTGFRSPAVAGGSPGIRNGIEMYGRGGVSVDNKWQDVGAATLHGVCTSGFPNLFFNGVAQSVGAPNYSFMLGVSATHVVHIVGEAERRAAREGGSRAVVEVTKEAEEAWSMEIMGHAAFFATMMGCTPGYINSEGESLGVPTDPKEMFKKSRASVWSQGTATFTRRLEEYRAEGSLRGLEVTVVRV